MNAEVNGDLVRARGAEIRDAVQKISSYASQEDVAFFADERNLYTGLHLLLVAIEVSASLCNHLAAKRARRAPGGYAECFETLKELGVVDEPLAQLLVRMARFRNVLVHRYWKIDAGLVLRFAREDLGDFEALLGAVTRFLRSRRA